MAFWRVITAFPSTRTSILVLRKQSSASCGRSVRRRAALGFGQVAAGVVDLPEAQRIAVGVDYASDVESVKALMVATALEIPDVLREPLPEAYFTSFGDHCLNLVLFIWVEDYPKLFATLDKVNIQLLTRFREQGVTIPFPTRTIISQKDDA